MTMMQTREYASLHYRHPRRYSHSPVEVFAPSDLENLIEIVATAITEL
jgi:putative aminopeptidase FrvX